MPQSDPSAMARRLDPRRGSGSGRSEAQRRSVHAAEMVDGLRNVGERMAEMANIPVAMHLCTAHAVASVPARNGVVAPVAQGECE